jgi:hypothetical protein
MGVVRLDNFVVRALEVGGSVLVVVDILAVVRLGFVWVFGLYDGGVMDRSARLVI